MSSVMVIFFTSEYRNINTYMCFKKTFFVNFFSYSQKTPKQHRKDGMGPRWKQYIFPIPIGCNQYQIRSIRVQDEKLFSKVRSRDALTYATSPLPWRHQRLPGCSINRCASSPTPHLGCSIPGRAVESAMSPPVSMVILSPLNECYTYCTYSPRRVVIATHFRYTYE